MFISKLKRQYLVYLAAAFVARLHRIVEIFHEPLPRDILSRSITLAPLALVAGIMVALAVVLLPAPSSAQNGSSGGGGGNLKPARTT